MLHLLKFHPLTNLSQVSLHLRRCAFLISQHCASFRQDPGPPLPEHCHQLCDVSFKRILRRHGSNFSCSQNVFSHHLGDRDVMTSVSQWMCYATCGQTMTWVHYGTWLKAGQSAIPSRAPFPFTKTVNNVGRAISLGRSGMFGKACRILQSSGIP